MEFDDPGHKTVRLHVSAFGVWRDRPLCHLSGGGSPSAALSLAIAARACRKAGNSLRITAQLIEAETGAHLWADRFDGALDDVFELQDQITDTVIGIVEPSLQRSEIERARRKSHSNQ